MSDETGTPLTPIMSGEQSKSNGRETSSAILTGVFRSLNWDVHLIDRLLYFFSPAILLICVLLEILFNLVLPDPEPKTSMACNYPRQFTSAQIRYADFICGNGLASYYSLVPRISDNTSSLHWDEIVVRGEDNVYQWVQLFPLLSMVCFLPLVAWRLIGRADGAGVLLLSKRRANSFISIIWFLMISLAGCVLPLYIPELIPLAPQFSPVATPLSTIYCSYMVRGLGGDHHVTVQCGVMTTEGDDTMSKYRLFLNAALHIWFYGVGVLKVLSLTVSLFVLGFCCIESFRKSLLERLVLGVENPCKKTTPQLSASQAFILVHAERNGHSQDIVRILQDQVQFSG